MKQDSHWTQPFLLRTCSMSVRALGPMQQSKRQWMQRLAGVETVAHNELIKMIRDRWKRMVAKPTKKKEPITPEMLLSIVESFS